MNIKDLKGIKSLVQLMGNSDLTEITIEEDGVKLTLKRERSAPPAPQPVTHQVSVPAPAPAAPAAPAAPEAASGAPAPAAQDEGLHYVTAPLVGTYYSAPSPDSEPYAQAGDKVKKGQTLCIIEAMKLMNEIESDVDGTVVEVLVENASPVEFGARILAIKPN